MRTYLETQRDNFNSQKGVRNFFKSNATFPKLRTIDDEEALSNKPTNDVSENSYSIVNFGSVAETKNLGEAKSEGTSKTGSATTKPKSMGRPVGIEKTEVSIHKLHFGARYKHTLKSSGGNLHGIHITEKVKKVKDDFKTGLPGVPTGKYKAVINKNHEVGDRIWLSFGAIAPAVKRLLSKKKPGESLLGKLVDHQELFYWENKKPAGWRKFTDVKIEQRLYDLPGKVVVTIDNGVMAKQENFTPFPPAKK